MSNLNVMRICGLGIKKPTSEKKSSDVGFVSAKGFEPLTVCLEGRCSIQLSYAPIK